ncbi:hypothetical protein SEA_FUZZBUSTER_32 [Microbacterium phage FuzzBuster]|uniref:Uncharacterized protein n=1 Tax=Microbacterium phage FuzzBuster TaxID=2590935 RepID=A0A516KV10_9CAUD|nr:hypothetical protein SEA_FUZZBUSTER_32 [Microbacterium phage FuzzBuster]
MGKVRVFYGHEGVVPPTGLRTRSAAPAQPDEAEVEVDEIVADDPNGEPTEIVGEPVEDGEIVAPGHFELADGSEPDVDEDGNPVLPAIDDEAEVAEEEAPAEELPNGDWTVGEIEEWASNQTPPIDLTGATKTKATRLARINDTLKGE